MNINPFSIIYYYHPDKVGGPSPEEAPKNKKPSPWWKVMDWIAEILILVGARLHHACRVHERINSMRRDMNDRPVPLS